MNQAVHRTRVAVHGLLSIWLALFGSSELNAASFPPGFEETVWVDGLTRPTAMAFAPDGRLFVAQKTGELRIIKDGALLEAPFLAVPVKTTGERGLLGITFDPDFAKSGHVYIYYTLLRPKKNRVSRFTASTLDANRATPNSELLILDDIPSSHKFHNGGGLRFGPDGMLYVSVGEGRAGQKAQSLGDLRGKLLRIDPSKHPNIVPPDNPFVGTPGARGEVWALGLRNPFSFAFDPPTGRLLINDVGEVGWEEINLGQAGKNYGWPECEGECEDPRFENPIHSYDHGTARASITGGVVYRGSQFPSEFQGDYFFGDFMLGFIKRMKPDGSVLDFSTSVPRPVDLEAPRPVDLKVGPDGSLYYLSYELGTVYRVRYAGGKD